MFTRLHFIVFLVLTACASAVEPLTRIADIRALTPEVVAKRLTISFEATVAVYDPEVTSFFVSDGESGIYSLSAWIRTTAPCHRRGPATGSASRVSHTSDISSQTSTSRASNTSRPARRPRLEKSPERNLQEPGLDCEWVEFQAVVKATSVDQWGGLYFDLLADGWRMKACVSRMEKFKTPPWDLLERTVRVQCAAGSRFHEQRQMSGTIRIASQPGKGTTPCVTVPAPISAT